MGPGGASLFRWEDGRIVESAWRRFEVVSAEWRDRFDQEMAEVGFPPVPHGERGFHPDRFVREMTRMRVPAPLVRPLPWVELLEAASVPEEQVQRLRVQGSPWTVKGGFSFRVGRMGVYGLRETKGVTLLGFEPTDQPALDAWDARNFATFLARNELLLVHWESGRVAEGVRALETYFLRGIRRGIF